MGLPGRQFGDSALIASWLNCNASVSVPSGVFVLHLSHLHPHPRAGVGKRERSMWDAVRHGAGFNKMPHFQLVESANATSATASSRRMIIDARGVVTEERLAPAACV